MLERQSAIAYALAKGGRDRGRRPAPSEAGRAARLVAESARGLRVDAGAAGAGGGSPAGRRFAGKPGQNCRRGRAPAAEDRAGAVLDPGPGGGRYRGPAPGRDPDSSIGVVTPLSHSRTRIHPRGSDGARSPDPGHPSEPAFRRFPPGPVRPHRPAPHPGAPPAQRPQPLRALPHAHLRPLGLGMADRRGPALGLRHHRLGADTGCQRPSLSKPSWSAKADHPRVCQPLIR